tara:strand:- start:8637 stop:8762 length:126 start_codon:yes stop_codon:yes gene_type:complete
MSGFAFVLALEAMQRKYFNNLCIINTIGDRVEGINKLAEKK